MARKAKNDWGFLLERAPEALEELNGDARRAIIDLFRSDVPLGRMFRDWLAFALEGYFFPRSPHQKRKTKRRFEASVIELQIATIQRLEGCSKPEAREKVAALLVKENNGLGIRRLAVKKKDNGAPVEALERRLRRARRERGHGDKNF